MEILNAMLNAYLEHSLTIEDFSEQFIDFWNDIRIEQNKAIDEAGIRKSLDELWNQYKTGKMDEIAYGMQWTETLTPLTSVVRIAPQSIVYAIGNELYSILIMYQEEEHLDEQDVPTQESIREYVQTLIDAIET